MSTHPPSIPSPVPDPSGDADLVPGDPPVPITVWRTAGHNDEPTNTVTVRLAYRLVSAYSRPGEAVVDLTDGHALTGACLRGRRLHHPAWFTDNASLIIGPTHTAGEDESADPAGPAEPGSAAAGHTWLEEDGPEPPELSAWFGDDLTDPDLPPPAEPVPPLPADGSLLGATSLVVAAWPLHGDDAAARVRLAWLLAACAKLLRPGGCLVLVVGVPAGLAATPEDFGPLVVAAASAGLGYLQHIVAVAARADGDHFVYHVRPHELVPPADGGGGAQVVVHARVHADLLVFTPTGGGRHA
ncbi:hypothetical protein [Phytohabitans kaempferiae]|uniref:Uncharacterized protein n=1 Tax=Phytohabitans kaempferiae TaxID=1620943 RepID=A0ABV6MBM2_9ACTN